MVVRKTWNAFFVFDANNPQVWSLFKHYALEAVNSKRKQFGARMIWERMRWYTGVEAEDDTVEYNLNDRWPPCFSRKFTYYFPQFAHLFEQRNRGPGPHLTYEEFSTMTDPTLKPDKSKALCSGCYDDFYNQARVDGCWSYEGATVCQKKFVHVDQRPPWTNYPEWTLSCHTKQRFVSVGLDQER